MNAHGLVEDPWQAGCVCGLLVSSLDEMNAHLDEVRQA